MIETTISQMITGASFGVGLLMVGLILRRIF